MPRALHPSLVRSFLALSAFIWVTQPAHAAPPESDIQMILTQYEKEDRRTNFKKLAEVAHKALEDARAGTMPSRYSMDTATRILRDASHFSSLGSINGADIADIRAVVNWTLRPERSVLDAAHREFGGKSFPIDEVIREWLTPDARYSPWTQSTVSAGGRLQVVASLRNRFNLPLSNWELLGEHIRGSIASMDGRVATVDEDMTPVLEDGKLTFAVRALSSGSTSVRLGELTLVKLTVSTAQLLVEPDMPRACFDERVSFTVRLAMDPMKPLLYVDVGKYPSEAAGTASTIPLDTGGSRVELPRVVAPCSLQVTVKDVSPPVTRGVNVTVLMPPDSLRGAERPTTRRLYIAGGAMVLLGAGTIWKWLDQQDKWDEYEADDSRPDEKYEDYTKAHDQYVVLGWSTVAGAAWTGWEYLRFRRSRHKFDQFEAWRRDNCGIASIGVTADGAALAMTFRARF